ncbi:exopolysaccharide Pel transporter PelG [Metabacillus sp. GX 13764]|uniref:exopolysaccharide Pel transporter PelG n=1 Tax=Metabacillus kandeliae TaxID=2900151 RepID=UPI001E577ED3|nr:exopolysaccharide Pel transporter PelG [Metabacillus kandeliae]MCD7035760.1 exopolysaccharide Pel transporter PelG [Metabacillus kandeliae]
MAGIGFQLQKMFKEDYYSSRVKAYLYSVFVTAGPWLLIIFTLFLIQNILGFAKGVNIENKELFLLSISYCFIFSQVLYGVQQLAVTRYVADCLYEKQEGKVFASFIGFAKITLLAAFLLWCIFAAFSELPLYIELLILGIFAVLNLIWVMLLYLSGAKNYQSIALAFLTGGGTGAACMVILLYTGTFAFGTYTQAVLMLASFFAGLGITLLWLTHAMYLTFPIRTAKGQFQYLTYFDRYPSLVICGFCYNAGLWASNWIIWIHEGKAPKYGVFFSYPSYDTALFYAYLTIIPIYMLFVVSIETRFYERYRTFYSAINQGGTLQQILTAKSKMLVVLKQELERLLRNQGLITAAVLLAAIFILPEMIYNDKTLEIFRCTAIGAFCNGMTLVMILLQLYFDDRKGAAWTAALFITGIAAATLLLLPLGYKGYGFGFALGSLISYSFGHLRLFTYVEKADYHAFSAKQPVLKSTLFTKTAAFLNERFSS